MQEKTQIKELENNDYVPYWFEYEIKRKGRAASEVVFTVYVRHQILIDLIPDLRLLENKSKEQSTLFQAASASDLSEQKQSFNTEIWVIISLLIEVSILCCLVFVSVYEFKTYSENALLRNYDLPSSNNNELKPTLKLKNEAIGFQVNQVEPRRKTDFTDKKQVLEYMIGKGINDFKVLAKLGFNFKQISSAIQNIN